MGKRTHIHRSKCPQKMLKNYVRNVMHHMLAHSSDVLRGESIVLENMKRHEPIPDEAIDLLQTARENLHRAKGKLAFLTDPVHPAVCVHWDDTGSEQHQLEYVVEHYSLLQRTLRHQGYEFSISYEKDDFSRYDSMISGRGRGLPHNLTRDELLRHDSARAAIAAWENAGRPGPYRGDEHPPDDTAVDDETVDTADTAAPAVASSHQEAPATTSSPTEESIKQFLWRYWGRLPPASADTAPRYRHTRPTLPKTPPDARHYWLATRTDPPPGGVWSSPVESFGESESDNDDVPYPGPPTMHERSEVAEEIRRWYTPEEILMAADSSKVFRRVEEHTPDGLAIHYMECKPNSIKRIVRQLARPKWESRPKIRPQTPPRQTAPDCIKNTPSEPEGYPEDCDKLPQRQGGGRWYYPSDKRARC